MSHIRVKTRVTLEGIYGSTEEVTMYADHNNSSDYTTIYLSSSNGRITQGIDSFGEWGDRDEWTALQDLMHPYKEDGTLLDEVEHYCDLEWDEENKTYFEKPYNDSVYENNPDIKRPTPPQRTTKLKLP